jgi:choline kinase
VRGVVLAAGPGRRLRGLTAELPKTLLPLSERRTILDVVLANLRTAGLEEVAVVSGFAAERLVERTPDLERRHDLRIELIFNERAEEWNNAYSLWLARDAFAEGALIANGDTVHPASVERTLLSQRGADVLLAVDNEKTLGEEEMKVLAADGVMERIGKEVDPASAAGEYIGVALVEPTAATPLADALEATWRRDPSLYYEDGFQVLADRGGVVGVARIGKLDWVEVDDDEDLARAREIECRF